MAVLLSSFANITSPQAIPATPYQGQSTFAVIFEMAPPPSTSGRDYIFSVYDITSDTTNTMRFGFRIGVQDNGDGTHEWLCESKGDIDLTATLDERTETALTVLPTPALVRGVAIVNSSNTEIYVNDQSDIQPVSPVIEDYANYNYTDARLLQAVLDNGSTTGDSTGTLNLLNVYDVLTYIDRDWETGCISD